MQVFNRYVSGRSLTVFGFETLLVAGSLLIAALVSGSMSSALGALGKIAAATAVYELCFYYNDLYDFTLVHVKRQLAVHLLRAAGASAVALAVALLIVPSFAIGHGIFTVSLGLVLIAVPASRLMFD